MNLTPEKRLQIELVYFPKAGAAMQYKFSV
jgi:hypothetical protein